MALIDIFNAATDETFQSRCLAATWKAAQDIMAEAANTVNHQARIDWASRMLKDEANITPRQLAMQVLRNATIAANPAGASDGDLQFQVNSVIDSLIQVG